MPHWKTSFARRVRGACLSAVVLVSALIAAAPNARAAEPASIDRTAPARTSGAGETSLRAGVFAKSAPESVEDLLAIERQVQKIVATISEATVGVRIGAAQGSGVIVSRDGYVLTAAHVTGGPGRDVTVILPGGQKVAGTTLGLNRGVDAGLIKIDEPGPWPVAEMGDIESVQVGDWCVATGHPGGYRDDRPPVVRLGRVVSLRRSVIQTDCTLVGGDSGGPLFDIQGRVIGVNSRIGRPTSWNFHVPVSAYIDGWDRLAKSEVWGGEPQSGDPMMGVGGDDHPRGCRVTRIVPGFPAEKAGLAAGDIITHFDGEAVDGFDGLVELVAEREAGERIVVEFLRDGRSRKTTLTLAERP